MPKPIIALAVTALLIVPAGCGSSAHRRAHAVLDRAEAAIVEIHALYEEAYSNLAQELEGWPESCPATDLPDVLTLLRQQRHVTSAINAAEASYYRCLREINAPDWKRWPPRSSTRSSSKLRPTKRSGTTSTYCPAPGP